MRAYLELLLVVFSEVSQWTFALIAIGEVACVGRGASHCGSRRWVEKGRGIRGVASLKRGPTEDGDLLMLTFLPQSVGSLQ